MERYRIRKPRMHIAYVTAKYQASAYNKAKVICKKRGLTMKNVTVKLYPYKKRT